VAEEPQLLAAGRASEILDLGDGRVLRRFKSVGNPEREALVMRYARGHGYPVPAVLEVGVDSLVLERIEGPTMLQMVLEDQRALATQARVLAELHEELHRIEAPDGFPAWGSGDRLLHLDLHPENVILSPAGPVVIDWTNARRGEAMLDVAYTWLIVATSDGGGQLALDFAEAFLSHFDRDAVRQRLDVAARYRSADENVTDAEREAIRALVARELGQRACQGGAGER
jgi:aminoglycoside phosphotransferase (APT) family kinase protein